MATSKLVVVVMKGGFNGVFLEEPWSHSLEGSPNSFIDPFASSVVMMDFPTEIHSEIRGC